MKRTITSFKNPDFGFFEDFMAYLFLAFVYLALQTARLVSWFFSRARYTTIKLSEKFGSKRVYSESIKQASM